MSGLVEVGCDGTVLRLFVDVAAPQRRMVIGGATETAVALAAAAAAAGYRVTVCDPRAAFLSPARFPGATEVVVGRAARRHPSRGAHPAGRRSASWATTRTSIPSPSRSPSTRPPASSERSARGAPRVGAASACAIWGSTQVSLERLRMPIGLDIGARTPAELAVAVLAEVLAVRNGLDATPLRAGDGPIHRVAAAR